jgi:dephospho-CoA kinase
MGSMHVFGLTGGIASGKSAVATRIRELGVPVIDADQLSRDAVAVGTEGLRALVLAFGTDILQPDGALDRKKLAAVVFGDDERRRTLNAIVHPLVGKLSMEATERHRQAGAPLVCYEAALIVENGIADAFRPLIVVSAPEALQLARAALRDGATADEAAARIRAQMPLAAKVATADHVIENTGTLEDLRRRTDEVVAEIASKLGVALPPMLSSTAR